MTSAVATESATEVETASVDRVPLIAGMLAFVAVALFFVVLLPAWQDLPSWVHSGWPWALLATALLALRFTTPSTRLLPAVKHRREQRRLAAAVGALAAGVALGGYTVTFQLSTWTDFLVLASRFLLAFGLVLMLNTRFTIGPN